MDIIDQLDDEINKIEYDVMLPALPQSLNDVIESAKNEPQVSSGIANAPVVIDADFGTGGMDSIEDIVDAIDLLADDMIDNLGLVGNTLATGFAEDARKSKRTNDLLQSINRVLTEQWEREQKDRAFGVKNKMSDELPGNSTGAGTGLATTGSDNGSDSDFDLPFDLGGGKDKDKNKSKNKSKNKPKGFFNKVLGKLNKMKGNKYAKGLAALSGIFLASEASGISNVSGIFGDEEDKVMEPQPVADTNDIDYLNSDTQSVENVATSNVTNSSALNMDSNTFNSEQTITTPVLPSPIDKKVAKLRNEYYGSVDKDNSKINSEISTLKTFSAITDPKVSEDMPLIPDMGMGTFAATAMLGAPLLLNRSPVERMPSMSAYREALPNRNLPIQSQPRLPSPVKADVVKPANPSKLPKAGPKMRMPKMGVGGALGALMSGMSIYDTATDESLSGRDKTESIAGSLGTIGAYSIPLVGQAMGLADMATMGVNLALGTEIPSLGGLVGEGVSDLTAGAFDLFDMAMGNEVEPRAEGDKRFYDNMTLASSLGPLGMLSDMTGLTEYLTDTFFGSDSPTEKKPEVETISNNAPSKANVADAIPTTAPAPTTKADSPYIKTLAKAVPYYAKVHGKDPSKSGDVLDIFRIPSTSQGTANAMAKDYMGEDFSAEVAIEEYNQALAAINTNDPSMESNIDTLVGDVATSISNNEVSTADAYTSMSENTNQDIQTSLPNDVPSIEQGYEEAQRENYVTALPQPEVVVNLDEAAEVKQSAPQPIKTADNKPKVITRTKTVQPPLSLGNISGLENVAGVNHLNKSIG